MTTVADWLRGFAAELEQPAPDGPTIEQVLELAAIAAHGSSRQAAPVACWLAGAAGIELDEAIRLAQGIGASD